MVLLHVLIMSVMMSLLAVMVLKWILGYYMQASRTLRAVAAGARSHGYFQSLYPGWFTGSIPSDISLNVPGQINGVDTTHCVRVLSCGTGMKTIKVVSEQDSASAATDCPPAPACP